MYWSDRYSCWQATPIRLLALAALLLHTRHAVFDDEL
jgi:hypothetical protein